MMKKKLWGAVMLIALLSLSVNAQEDILRAKTSTDKLMMGLKLGLNLSNYSKGNFDMRPAMHAGILLDVPLKRNWSVTPGIMVNMKGARNSVERYWYSADLSNGQVYDYFADEKYFFSPLYIDIPITFGYKYKIDPYSHLYFGVGPYVSVAVGGKMKKEFTGETAKIDLYNKDSYSGGTGDGQEVSYDLGYKRFNAGLNFEFGYSYEGWLFSLGYELGLTAVSNHTQSVTYKFGDKISTMPLVIDGMQHRVLKISLGYFFNL